MFWSQKWWIFVNVIQLQAVLLVLVGVVWLAALYGIAGVAIAWTCGKGPDGVSSDPAYRASIHPVSTGGTRLGWPSSASRARSRLVRAFSPRRQVIRMLLGGGS